MSEKTKLMPYGYYAQIKRGYEDEMRTISRNIAHHRLRRDNEEEQIAHWLNQKAITEKKLREATDNAKKASGEMRDD